MWAVKWWWREVNNSSGPSRFNFQSTNNKQHQPKQQDQKKPSRKIALKEVVEHLECSNQLKPKETWRAFKMTTFSVNNFMKENGQPNIMTEFFLQKKSWGCVDIWINFFLCFS